MTTTFSEILKLDWTGSSKIIAYLQPIFYFTIIEKRKLPTWAIRKRRALRGLQSQIHSLAFQRDVNFLVQFSQFQANRLQSISSDQAQALLKIKQFCNVRKIKSAFCKYFNIILHKRMKSVRSWPWKKMSTVRGSYTPRPTHLLSSGFGGVEGSHLLARRSSGRWNLPTLRSAW